VLRVAEEEEGGARRVRRGARAAAQIAPAGGARLRLLERAARARSFSRTAAGARCGACCACARARACTRVRVAREARRRRA
jgi:hypothetical protein